MKNKKLISVLMILSIIFCLSACGKQETPETAMDNALQAILNQDDATAESYFGSNAAAVIYNDAEKTPEEVEESKDFVTLTLQHLSYEIVKTEENDDTATVIVDITNADLGTIFTTVMQKAFSEALSYAFAPEDQRPSEEEMENMYMQWFRDALDAEDVAMLTKTVAVTMNYEEDHWKIDSSRELADALTGGLLSMAEGLANDSSTQ